MQYEILREGLVGQCEPDSPTAIACGSRTAVTTRGDIVCSYMVQSALGVNDFKPVLARSTDCDTTWQEQGLIWPHLRDTYSIFGSVSAASTGDLFFFGSRTPIGRPGETFWSEITQGLKPNELIWAKSMDHGVTWTEPKVIPMPIAGSAEAPGPMCITRDGRWVCCYSPYNTFDSTVTVDRSQVVCLVSTDCGQTWKHSSMLRFPDKNCQGAEAWVIELTDGRLLGAAWHSNETLGPSLPNTFALSADGGTTWSPTCSTDILGQSCSLAAITGGGAAFVYNQRQHGDVGVWLAVAYPNEDNFGVTANAIIWRAVTASQDDASNELKNWTSFAFGEPSVTVLPDGDLLVTLWCIQNGVAAIRYIKLRMAQAEKHE